MPPQLQPWAFPPGPDARRGHGPPKGEGGRPRNEFKRLLRELASDAAVLGRLRALLVDCPEPDKFLKALAFVTEHGYGKATQPITAGPSDEAAVEELRAMSDETLLGYYQTLRAKAAREPARN